MKIMNRLMNRLVDKGLSLRTLHKVLVFITVVLSAMLVFSTFHLTSTFRKVTDASEEHMKLEKAALELMEASDYLTESVQRYTINGDSRFLDQYFEEAFESKRREEAISKMNADPNTQIAAKSLEKALEESVKLMDMEYYAMKLMIEAKNVKDYPELLKSVELSAADKALSAEQKMKLATEKVMDDDYYKQKDLIRDNMQECLSEIDNLTTTIDRSQMTSMHRELNIVRIIILLLILSILFMVWLTAYLGIDPIVRATDQIKEDEPINESGANEFRYLAQAYNKMYSVYKKSLEHLNFKASHDELTGAYNRAGYDLLLSSIDMTSTYMLLFDVDDFKSINDNHGHEIGDKALVRLVQVFRGCFRSDDYICRIGGDEFVVFMVHSSEMKQHLISSKIEQINRELSVPENGVPAFSVSVGITHGTQASSPDDLFEKTDMMLYKAKRNGRNAYAFYSPESLN